MSAEEENDEKALLQKKEYKAFRTDLVSALTAFDRANDWADLIRYLQRLNDVLTRHDKALNVIPEKSLLGKRLSQCLDASLQPGVHLKALEAYVTIFARLGPQQLARDLPIYASGLFPLLSDSSTPVKRALIALYEESLLPIGKPLAQVLDGFIMALLPALEDETSEFYSRTLDLLRSLKVQLDDDDTFVAAAWRTLLLAPNRATAATYLNQLYRTSEQTFPSAHLFVPALVTALGEQNTRVQRNVLDLMLNYLPADSQHLSSLRAELFAAVLRLLLRTEFSLHKRVFNWLCGSAEDGAADTTYFRDKSRAATLEALDMMLAEARAGTELGALATLVRVPMALVDREELYESAAHDVVLVYLRHACIAREKGAGIEVESAAGQLIEQIGAEALVEVMTALLNSKSHPEGLSKQDFELLTFALNYISGAIEDGFIDPGVMSEMPGRVVANLSTLEISALGAAFSFCGALCEMLDACARTKGEAVDMHGTDQKFFAFFQQWAEANVTRAPDAVYSAYTEVDASVEEAAELEVLQYADPVTDVYSAGIAGCGLLVALARLAGPDQVPVALSAAVSCVKAMSKSLCATGILCFSEIVRVVERDSDEPLGPLVEVVAYRCWRLLEPDVGTAPVAVARLWVDLEALSPRITSVVIADGILSSASRRRSRNLQRYACLWHSAATSDDTHEYVTYYDAPRVLYAFQTLQNIIQTAAEMSQLAHTPRLIALEQAEPSVDTAAALAALYGGDTGSRTSSHVTLGGLLPASSYVQALAISALGFVRSRVPDRLAATEGREDGEDWMRTVLGSSSFPEQHSAVTYAAAEFLSLLLQAVRFPSNVMSRRAREFADAVLLLLERTIRNGDTVLQIHLIDSVEALLAAEGRPFEAGEAAVRASTGSLYWTATERSPQFLAALREGLVKAGSPRARGEKDTSDVCRRWLAFASSACDFLKGGLAPFVQTFLTTTMELLEAEAAVRERGSSRGVAEVKIDNSNLILLVDGFAEVMTKVLDGFDEMRQRNKKASGLIEESGGAPDVPTVPPAGAHAAAVSDTTMSSMNPFKLFSDLKDMIVGSHADAIRSNADPRQEALQNLVLLLPQVVSTTMRVWCSILPAKLDPSRSSRTRDGSHRSRTLVVGALESLLRRFPTDLVAAFVGYWQQCGMSPLDVPSSIAGDPGAQAVEMLIAVPGATLESICAAVCEVFGMSLGWDEESAVAQAAKSRKVKRGSEVPLQAVASHSATRPGDSLPTGDKSEIQTETAGGAVGDSHKGLLFPGDFFAEFRATDVQTASLQFLGCFFEKHAGNEDLVTAWPVLYNSFKDVFTPTLRPSVALEVLNVLNAYVKATPGTLPDRRQKKELSQVVSTAVTACTAIAEGTFDANLAWNEKDKSAAAAGNAKAAAGDAKPNGKVEGAEDVKRAHLVAKGMSAMAKSLLPLLDVAFVEDRPGAVAALTTVVESALKLLKGPEPGKGTADPNVDTARYAAAELLRSCSGYPWALKAIKRDVIALIDEPKFFNEKSRSLLRKLAETLIVALDTEKAPFAAIGAGQGGPGLGPGAITAVFAGRDSELVSRARTIRRITFLIFYSKNGQFAGQVSSVLEKLRDSLRVRSNRLTTETFLCLRVLLLRTGSKSIVPFRASIVAELLRILEDPQEDVIETVAALRFLDLITLLRVPEFSYEQCFFFSAETSSESQNVPLVTRLARSLSAKPLERSTFSQLRVDSSVPVFGGPMGTVDFETMEAYAQCLCERVQLSNKLLTRANVEVISSELEGELLADLF